MLVFLLVSKLISWVVPVLLTNICFIFTVSIAV